MSIDIKIEQDPYGEGKIYKKRKVTLEPGVTVLVGCNGCGKTTFLKIVKEVCDEKKIPCLSYDNLRDGHSHARNTAFARYNYTLGATLMFSSEGEQIVTCLGQHAAQMGQFVKKHQDAKQIVLLFDAVDSGFSIDNVLDLKEYLFDKLIQMEKDKEIYILVSANAYEMTRGERCLDVAAGVYRQFKTYDSFRNFILKSKELKIERDKKNDEKKEQMK